ncbi:HAD family hydrolase [Amycolatopsis magusensis]|uniref:Phosphoglycolate phosphatase-like HAD superfamily hydrolase n=1 Tax=Amycolatopsis magusensis TaxID=882444 RepID=A0ABS4PRZ5_9PSEU|nr:HAD hydrolase-like protein [Amycolatopsis magusensis]MBP2182202.1 phosphoglycolate phosphatase-like HAD superfamily hydrolase [Amycolatopsis magusensis]
MTAEDLLTSRDHVVIALDGPVAELPGRNTIAARLRVLVADGRLPRKVARTEDPFAVLAHAATIGPGTERAVYAQLCRLETELAAAARITPGVEEAFAKLATAGTRLTVVSALAVEAVRTILVMHGLDRHVQRIAGRAGPDLENLPPAAGLIIAALRECLVPVEHCLFVGSTDADLTAGRAAGVETVRYRGPGPWFDALDVARSTGERRAY